jgi:hypothetical protein
LALFDHLGDRAVKLGAVNRAYAARLLLRGKFMESVVLPCLI